jgi:hypothetical protein
MRLAWKDTVWHYENMPLRHTISSGTQAFDIDRQGNTGLAYIDSSWRCWYALKTDTGWIDVSTPFSLDAWPAVQTGFDTAGVPMIALQLDTAFVLARRPEATWVTDTIATNNPEMNPAFAPTALGSRSDGVIWGVFVGSFSWPDKDIFSSSLRYFLIADTWLSTVTLVGGTGNVIFGESGCIGPGDSVHASCWEGASMGSGLYLDQTLIDPARVTRTAVQFDTLGRPQIAYSLESGPLLYRYSDSRGWHVFDVGISDVSALDLKLDENSQPIIAYTTSDGVFLAHGVGVTGIEEYPRPQASSRKLQPTVLRRLPSGVVAFDAMGRRVTRARAGVYFVATCGEWSTASVRKIVIQH